jgi:hypothetical protein
LTSIDPTNRILSDMRLILAVCAALLVASTALGSDSVQRDLEQGMRKLAAQKYKDAIKSLEHAVKSPTATRAQRARALEALGECYVATRRLPDAESAYSRLLAENPRADLRPGVSPKLRDFFLEVKKKRFPEDMVEFRQESQSPDGSVVIHLLDPWRKVARVVRVSRVGDGEWTRTIVSSTDGLTYRVQPPPSADKPGEWFVEAQGPDGVAVSTVGTASTPFYARANNGAGGTPKKGTQEVPLASKSKPGSGTVAGTVTTTESATVVKNPNPWVTDTEAPVAVTAPPPAEQPPAQPSEGHTLLWVVIAAAVVVAAGAGVGGYVWSQQPSGYSQISVGVKK